ncbi:alpha/beta fold hydrolase [Mastigocoleus testarum]|uniref:Alpha/beta hydrolase n=1 Tax=Mastigocoleus testarum BC008 TaxID=371196 RepID=A0A0V7ZBC4_9CYAN|nr:alpha/beta hydrolase [Mastigocoleus testarum]KST61806.1 alpha/beta hydrolase [Mastigocoleus testarum BC008]
MPYINVRGVDHYYEWIEKPLSGYSKPVMVFIHGWAGSARYWRTTANALSEKFHCLLYDLRGFGRSQSKVKNVPNDSLTDLSYELEEYARDLGSLLEELKIQQVYLMAHSMGASIGTLFLNIYPQKVNKAILACSGIFEYDEKAFSAFHKFGGYVVKFRPKWLAKIPLVDRIFMARFLARSIAAKERQAFLADFLEADYSAALGTIFTSVSKKQAEIMPSEFSRLTVPTLIVSGEYDKIIPAELGQQAAALNKVVKFKAIENTGHFPMLEDAASYLLCVKEFLE